MSVIHFLNVKDGDCTWIKHEDGKITVMDVCNASTKESVTEGLKFAAKPFGSFHQKEHPVNPIEYLRSHGVSSVFRFILTHPDMDHMDGIEVFFNEYAPINFWDTAHTKKWEVLKGRNTWRTIGISIRAFGNQNPPLYA